MLCRILSLFPFIPNYFSPCQPITAELETFSLHFVILSAVNVNEQTCPMVYSHLHIPKHFLLKANLPNYLSFR